MASEKIKEKSSFSDFQNPTHSAKGSQNHTHHATTKERLGLRFRAILYLIAAIALLITSGMFK